MSKILFIIEIGGFPLKINELKDAGHEIELIGNMRKGISLLKKFRPDVVVAEFQYTSQFRDRDSNLDTILTQIVSHSPHTQLIALVEQEQQVHFERLKSRFDNIHGELYFPFEESDLTKAVLSLVDPQSN